MDAVAAMIRTDEGRHLVQLSAVWRNNLYRRTWTLIF